MKQFIAIITDYKLLIRMIEIISLAWRVDIQGILVFWLHIKMVDN
jgi:hypothetical protein